MTKQYMYHESPASRLLLGTRYPPCTGSQQPTTARNGHHWLNLEPLWSGARHAGCCNLPVHPIIQPLLLLLLRSAGAWTKVLAFSRYATLPRLSPPTLATERPSFSIQGPSCLAGKSLAKKPRGLPQKAYRSSSLIFPGKKRDQTIFSDHPHTCASHSSAVRRRSISTPETTRASRAAAEEVRATHSLIIKADERLLRRRLRHHCQLVRPHLGPSTLQTPLRSFVTPTSPDRLVAQFEKTVEPKRLHRAGIDSSVKPDASS